MKRVAEPMEVRASGVDEIGRVEVAITPGYVTRGTILESRRVSSLGSAHHASSLSTPSLMISSSHTLYHSVHRMLQLVLHRKLPLKGLRSPVLA